MYATGGKGKWVGPFCKRGEPCVDLVMQELEHPGSVIPPGWIHPAELERRELEQSILDRRAMWESRRKSMGLPAEKPKLPPETIEMLLRQGLTTRQICRTLECTAEEVHAEESRIGIKAAAGYNPLKDDLPKEPQSPKETQLKAAERRQGKRMPKIPPKPEEVVESPELEDEVRSAAALNPGWSHAELATEFGLEPERIGQILAGAQVVAESYSDE